MRQNLTPIQGRFNKYIRMSPEGVVDSSGTQDASGLPQDWSWERFQVVQVGAWEPTARFQLNTPRCRSAFHEGPLVEIPRAMWRVFQLREPKTVFPRQVKPYLPPGSVVAFHNAAKNRFLRMNLACSSAFWKPLVAF